MTIEQIKNLAELIMLIAACVAPVIWIVLEKRIDARIETKLAPIRSDLETLCENDEDLEGRTAAVEWFRDQNMVNINAIPRTLAILERLESTLERLDQTLGDVRESVARMEGSQ